MPEQSATGDAGDGARIGTFRATILCVGPTRATVSFALAAMLAAGCALSHERPSDGTSRPARRECDPGAITYCTECERPVCCLHFCREDRTWSTCGYVHNACPDGGVGESVGDRDR